MSTMHRLGRKLQRFAYIDAPDNPLRVECRMCDAGPGARCRKNGLAVDFFHSMREADFNRLREMEAKLRGWNATYAQPEAAR